MFKLNIFVLCFMNDWILKLGLPENEMLYDKILLLILNLFFSREINSITNTEIFRMCFLVTIPRRNPSIRIKKFNIHKEKLLSLYIGFFDLFDS